MCNIVNSLKDPYWVSKFQTSFGVEKLSITKANSSSKWVTIEDNQNSQDNHIINKKNENILKYKVHNRFWLHLFQFGSFLGEEIFYAFLFSFLIWNVDSVIGRRVFLVGYATFYIGQSLKDIIRWPRPPMPDVVRIDKRYAEYEEYGMPSTHAMMSFSLSLSIIFFTINKPYWPLCVAIGIFSIVLVCSCRLYLGMHTLYDIIIGLLISSLILLVTIPFMPIIEVYLMTDLISPLIFGLVTLLSVIFYPQHVYTKTRGETALLTSSCWGAHLGTWLSWKLGHISNLPHQYSDASLSASIVGGLMRQSLGLLVLAVTYLIIKPLSKHVGCLLVGTKMSIIQEQKFHLDNKRKIFVDLFSKCCTFAVLGITLTTITPMIQKYFNCDRPEYWTETLTMS